MAVEILPLTMERVNALRGEWDDLVRNALTATPFQTREWAETVLSHSGGRGHLITVREGDDLVGLYPVRITSGPWRVARPLGVGPSDYLHPLARSEREPEVNAQIASALGDLPADLLDLHQVRSSFGFNPRSGTVEGETIEQARCLVIDLPPAFEAYRKTLSKSLRYDVNRIDKLEGVRLQTADTDSLGKHLDVFFELHRERWRSRGLPGAFGKRAETFQRAWTTRAIANGWLVLRTLFQNDVPVGSIYTLRFGATRYFYQAGMSPAAKAISPGTLLIAGSIREAIEEGQTAFDMMRGAEDYKRRWKPTREEVNERFLIPLSPHRGHAAAAFARQAWRVESSLRERFEGGSLRVPTWTRRKNRENGA